MQNRRDFLKKSGTLALAGLALPGWAETRITSAFPQRMGVQLYTTMSVIDQDVMGTLKQIADIGYKDIESAFSMKGGYYGMKPKAFAAVINDLGMTWQAHHVGAVPFRRPAAAPVATQDTTKVAQRPAMPIMKSLLNDTQQIMDEAAEGGLKYVVCASTPLKTMDEIKTSLEILNKAGETAKKAGLTFVYHNHTAEFEKVEGVLPFDMIATQISSDLLKFELDLAWATKAGVDIPALFNNHGGRFPLFHVKDLNKATQKPVEVGEGYVDFRKIFDASVLSGVKHLFVEQDQAPSPVENLSTSFKNLKKLL